MKDQPVALVFIDFPSNLKGGASFHHTTNNYYHDDWGRPCDDMRDAPWEDIFNLGACTAVIDTSLQNI